MSGTKYLDQFDIDILKAIEIIDKENISGLTAHAKAIRRFLRGTQESEYYQFFKKHKNICGKYPYISLTELQKQLDVLENKELITSERYNGRVIYSISKRMESFTKTLNQDQIYVLKRIEREIKIFVKNVETVDGQNRYSFYSYNNCFCYITKTKKHSYLKLHIKRGLKQNAGYLKPISLSDRNLDRALSLIEKRYTSNDLTKVKEKIKSGELFNEYSSDIEKENGFELMPHQKAGSIIASKYDKFAFFYDTGTGKTIMALEIMARKYKENGTKFLVIAPKPLIRFAWMDDSKRFPKMKLLPLSKNMTRDDYAKIHDYWEEMDGKAKKYTDEFGYALKEAPEKEEILEKLIERAHHFIINIDLIRNPQDSSSRLKKLNFSGLIIDESATIKNYYSGNAQRCRVIAKKMRYVYILSGLPAPNTYVDYYSQMKIIDPDSFSMTYAEFKNSFFIETRSKRWTKLRVRNGAKEKIAELVSKRSIFLKKNECIKLPPLNEKTISVELCHNTRNAYEHEWGVFAIKAKNGEKILIENKSITKLRELTSGFYINDGVGYDVSEEKINILIELLKDLGTKEKIIIWCEFKHEVRKIKSILETKMGYKVSTANSETKNLDKDLSDFRDGDANVLIANPQSIKYGLTFVNCSHAIFYSLSYSHESYYQARDRIYRNGQKHPCHLYYLVAENTIDEIMLACVKRKENANKIMERLVKEASHFDIKRIAKENAVN